MQRWCASGSKGGLKQPLAGAAEQVIISAAGLLLLVAVCLALFHIRAGHIGTHREWMLRAIGAALGIASVRIVALPHGGYAPRDSVQRAPPDLQPTAARASI